MAIKYILSKAESEKIRNIRFYQISFYEENGFPVDSRKKRINFPSLEMLQEMAFNKILKSGFHEITRVSPNEANCIVRVFNKTHFAYGEDPSEIHNLCGFNCFTKNFNTWTSVTDSCKYFELDFSKCLNRQYLYQDEYIDYNCNFFDCYVCVK